MPSPVGHALGGLIVGWALERRPPRGEFRRRWASSMPLMSALAAVLPDVDFLWGRHNMETHSITFAAIVGLAVYVWHRSPRLALACALAVASHVLFDWLGSDTTPPLGITALWPFSHEFYFANAFVFEAISRRYWLPNFLSHNLLAIVRELALLLPVAALTCFFRHRRVVH